MAIFEQATRAQQLRDPDFANRIFSLYGKRFPHIERCRKANKSAFSKMMKQPYSQHRAETLPIAADGSTPDGQDKTVFTSGDQGYIMQVWAQEYRSGGVQVTMRMESVEQADTASEYARQVLRDEEGFMLAMERMLLSSQAQNDASWGAGLTKTPGVFWSLSPTQATGSNPYPAPIRVDPNAFYTGTLAALTQDYMNNTIINSMVKQLRRKAVYEMPVGPVLKRWMSSWNHKVTTTANVTELRQTTTDAMNKKLMDVVDVFEFDDAVVNTEIDYNLACSFNDDGTWTPSAYSDTSGFFMEPDRFLMRFLRNISRIVPPDAGGGKRSFLDCDFCHDLTSPQGLGAIYVNS